MVHGHGPHRISNSVQAHTYRLRRRQERRLCAIVPGDHRLQAIELIGVGQPLQLVALEARQWFLDGAEGARVQIGDGRIAAQRKRVRRSGVQRVEQLDAQPAIVVQVGLGERRNRIEWISDSSVCGLWWESGLTAYVEQTSVTRKADFKNILHFYVIN